jgi:hypothetical protein
LDGVVLLGGTIFNSKTLLDGILLEWTLLDRILLDWGLLDWRLLDGPLLINGFLIALLLD